MIRILSIACVFVTFLVSSCSSDEPISTEPTVNYNLDAFPYSKLSTYGFFKGNLKDLLPIESVLPYEPASSLFTDYAHKKRFIWMPNGSTATYNTDHSVLNFPVGTILIKSFYYDTMLPSNQTKIIETRLMIRKNSGWIFANYIWNEEQTEAVLNNNGSTVAISWMQDGTPKSANYRIPNEVECLTCHKFNEVAVPIGPKPQNLNTTYTYTSGAKNQLQKWKDFGYLQSFPSSIYSTVNYKDETQSLELRLRSYVDMNCSHCHRAEGHCDYTPLKLAFNETQNLQNLGLCVVPNNPISGTQRIIFPGNHFKSTMYVRMNSTVDNVKMPIIGRSIVDEYGVNILKSYIQATTTPCN